MDQTEFCEKLASLPLSQTDKALAILWFRDESSPNVVMSSGTLSKILYEAGLSNPHSTRLAEQIRRTGKVITSSQGFRLKDIARTQIRNQLTSILGETKPKIEQELGYLPRDVWRNTRGYLETVCEQLNGCYQFGFYDAASVMVRRIAETLIIECYEYLKRENEIKGGDGNYLMLKDLINRVNASPGLSLGRDAKKALGAIKELGDRSAHNRRFRATKPDLDKLQSGVRVAVDEMIAMADLRR